jgi:hypothetical protein
MPGAQPLERDQGLDLDDVVQPDARVERIDPAERALAQLGEAQQHERRDRHDADQGRDHAHDHRRRARPGDGRRVRSGMPRNRRAGAREEARVAGALGPADDHPKSGKQHEQQDVNDRQAIALEREQLGRRALEQQAAGESRDRGQQIVAVGARQAGSAGQP